MYGLNKSYSFSFGFKHPSWPIVITFHIKRRQVTGNAAFASGLVGLKLLKQKHL